MKSGSYPRVAYDSISFALPWKPLMFYVMFFCVAENPDARYFVGGVGLVGVVCLSVCIHIISGKPTSDVQRIARRLTF